MEKVYAEGRRRWVKMYDNLNGNLIAEWKVDVRGRTIPGTVVIVTKDVKHFGWLALIVWVFFL